MSSAVRVRVTTFPETTVAALEHRGPPEREHETVRRLVDWRVHNWLPPNIHRCYGVYFTDPRTTPPAEHRVDFCISVFHNVPTNPHGVINKIIPGCRCAVARHHGPRDNNKVAAYLRDVWLPESGEAMGDLPIFFHYESLGPYVHGHEMIADVYMPLR